MASFGHRTVVVPGHRDRRLLGGEVALQQPDHDLALGDLGLGDRLEDAGDQLTDGPGVRSLAFPELVEDPGQVRSVALERPDGGTRVVAPELVRSWHQAAQIVDQRRTGHVELLGERVLVALEVLEELVGRIELLDQRLLVAELVEVL